MNRGRDLPAAAQDEWLTEQLRDSDLSVAYLNAALAEGDQAAFMLALRNVAKARGGVTALARETGMNRVALSRALSESGNPELRSLIKILDASGLQFVVVTKSHGRRARRHHGRSRGTVPVVSDTQRRAPLKGPPRAPQ
jgi:probable addiction module antidote protein